ncbi:hypothetical protein BESB_024910 [Besnoitia besnoiti]|uniref:Transmembrane protein n=1 Tax=Besnoitia besnoiti TaxID=94643 RepID=A0A2A9M0M6_BESBE|nr:uncharacterized protein BESB_024910 [Besnoitia besnoiti]PFH31525.1 hypothetical protein BESB_024910 [Besnoitia besnoiti]
MTLHRSNVSTSATRFRFAVHCGRPPPSQLWYQTEYGRMDGLWRLTNAPTADQADVPSIGEALARRSERKMQPPKIPVALDGCPILHAKAQEVLRSREELFRTRVYLRVGVVTGLLAFALFASGSPSPAAPFPASASLWRHPPPERSLAWHCRMGAKESHAAEGAPKVDAETASKKAKLWQTEAHASWGSALPTALHFPARFHPSRRDFSQSLPSQRQRCSSLCTTIKHCRLPRACEPLGGV